MQRISDIQKFNNDNNNDNKCGIHIKDGVFKTLPDHPVFFDGDDSDFIFEILEGVTRTSKFLSDGRRQILSFGYPGDIIGVSHNTSYHCDCDAVTQVTLRLYDKVSFYRTAQNDSRLCRHFFQLTASEINQMQEHFLMLGRKTAEEKLATFLSELMERNGVHLRRGVRLSVPMKRIDIADFLGLTIETVSRNLSCLKKEGIIDFVESKIINILDPQRLKMIAEKAGD